MAIEIKLSKNWVMRITKYWYGLYRSPYSFMKVFSLGFIHFIYIEKEV